MYVSIERRNNYYYVNGTKITCRQDFERLTKEEQFELTRQRKLAFNETTKPKNLLK